MRITEDVCRYAAEKPMSEGAALEEDLKQKATAFTNTGSKIYAKARLCNARYVSGKILGHGRLAMFERNSR
jgi:hypothetical protein